MHFGPSRAEADVELDAIFARAREAAKMNGGRGDAAWTIETVVGNETWLIEGRFTRPSDFTLFVDPKNLENITITWTPSAPELKDPRKRVLTGNLRTGKTELEHVDP